MSIPRGFAAALAAAGVSAAASAQCQPVWAGATGFDGPVYALASLGGSLYAGGSFTQAGGVPASRIARWDGLAWSPLGAGLNATCWALTVHNGELVAGGEFTSAGGSGVVRVARWNGSVWSGMNGPDGPVFALASFNGDLVVGGAFTRVGSLNADSIARWTGAGWAAYGPYVPAISDPVYNALAVYGNQLWVGGTRTVGFPGTPAPLIARYSGSAFSRFDATGQAVRALAAADTHLYVGGAFSSSISGAGSVSNIARFDGSAWQGLGTGVAGGVYAITAHGTDVIAAGPLTAAGGVPADRIARWDGASWSPLGAGLGPGIGAALASHGDALHAGGTFTVAGGQPATREARYACACYPNCDNSTVAPVLNVLDFGCFLNAFSAGAPYANCDHSTVAPVLNVLDFACFLNNFSAGCP